MNNINLKKLFISGLIISLGLIFMGFAPPKDPDKTAIDKYTISPDKRKTDTI